MPTAEYIGKNPNSCEAKIWQPWLASAAFLANEYGNYDKDVNGSPVNPLSYNETASVSLLVAAAQRSEMIALAEYVTCKAPQNGNGPNRRGRADLWLCDCQGHDWEFEFKQPHARLTGGSEALKSKMAASRQEAKTLLPNGTTLKQKGIIPVAGHIFFVGAFLDGRENEFDRLIRELCCSGEFRDELGTWVRHGWKIVPCRLGAPTYFIFDVMTED